MKLCHDRRFSRRVVSGSLVAGFAAVCGLTCLSLSSLSAMAQITYKRLPNHLPPVIREANLVGSVPHTETVPLALVLPLRNEAQLDALLTHIYDPNDPLYGHYLTTAQFNANYAPTQSDYNALIAFAKAQSLTVTATHDNRLVLDVSGPAQMVQSAFNVHLKNYQLPTGRVFRAPDVEPSVPVSIAGRLQSVIGLDTAGVWHTNSHSKAIDPLAFLDPRQTGSGPGSGLTPSDIKTAYNLSGSSQDGSGQTLGLFELDGYTASDITHYETYFGLPNMTLQNVLVDSYSGAAGSGAGEVTLDIELQIALAPKATKLYVYEGPNSSTGVIDTYNKIATDNLATSVSTSWGLAEKSNSTSALNSENTIFKQMASQGQSIFAAAGDSGAYDNGSTLSVDDPASQPYVTGVGGTKLTTNSAGGAWKSETTWNGGSVSAGAGGGGISTVWSIPSYQSQTGVITTASGGSTTMRNVPDVSLNADPNSGYSIYYNGGWYIYGGTSCAAPLWSAFTALVNQQRATAGKASLGFANTPLYTVGVGTNYTTDFHDIADSSTNLYYKAVTGYDLATGWGTFNGANLLTDLAGSGGTTPPPPPPPTQLLGNPGFENGSSNPSPWAVTAGVIDNSSSEPAHGGSWKAWLDGYGSAHTDTLSQTFALSSVLTKATLSFYLHIDVGTRSTTLHDTLKVQLRNSSGTVLTTLATYSNLNAASGYTQKTFDITSYKGQSVQVYLIGVEDGKVVTSFVVDDFALNVQ